MKRFFSFLSVNKHVHITYSIVILGMMLCTFSLHVYWSSTYHALKDSIQHSENNSHYAHQHPDTVAYHTSIQHEVVNHATQSFSNDSSFSGYQVEHFSPSRTASHFNYIKNQKE